MDNSKVLSLEGSSPIFTDTAREETNRLIFVKRIPGIISAEEFAKIVSEYAAKGPIIDIKYRRHTGGDKTAFALIYFKEEEDGKKAIEGLNGRHLEYQGQHRVLSAEKASRWTQQVSKTNLYVTNLPGHWTGDDLKSVFDKFGKVMQATVLPHPQIEEQNSGAGFVRFSNEEDASQAMIATDGKPATPGSDQILEVKYAKANLHKNRRSESDFRKRKAEFLSPNPKRLRYATPLLSAATLIPGLTTSPYLSGQQMVSTLPGTFGLSYMTPRFQTTTGLMMNNLQTQQSLALQQQMLMSNPSNLAFTNGHQAMTALPGQAPVPGLTAPNGSVPTGTPSTQHAQTAPMAPPANQTQSQQPQAQANVPTAQQQHQTVQQYTPVGVSSVHHQSMTQQQLPIQQQFTGHQFSNPIQYTQNYPLGQNLSQNPQTYPISQNQNYALGQNQYLTTNSLPLNQNYYSLPGLGTTGLYPANFQNPYPAKFL